MKTITTLALGVLLIGSASIAEAGPFDFLRGKPRQDTRYDHRHHNHRPQRMSTEARAQLKLRELGYYRGPIDGAFGRGSKAALVRFQRDKRLRQTGWLDERTRRALRI